MNPMSDAPTDGTVIEACFEGEWHLVYWSEAADDMSPYGTPGWAREDDRLLMLDLEGWRELPDEQERTIDEDGERAHAAADDAASQAADAAQERRVTRRAARTATAQRRELLEARYAALSGSPAPRMPLRLLRTTVLDLDRAHRFQRLGELLSELR